MDEKERKLSADDLMICDGEGGICIAGVFGGLHSGVSEKTKTFSLKVPGSIRLISAKQVSVTGCVLMLLLVLKKY